MQNSTRSVVVYLLLLIGPGVDFAQQLESTPAAQDQPVSAGVDNASPVEPVQPRSAPDKRVFGVLPNYRTANETGTYTPITASQKLAIGAKDSFDYPLLILGAGLAGLGQLTNQNSSFGQGMAGYARRFGTAYADQAVGNMMTEAIFPSLLHEDPRYFRRATGSKWSRTGYALTRIFVTRTDSGGQRFNYSEVLGNATSAAISTSYYPDNRTVGASVAKLGSQLATDAISQVLKEFWPDIKQKFFRRHE